MKERSILFNTEMVKAILEGRKTMTRRVIKPQPHEGCGHIRVEYFFPTKVDRHGEEYPGAKIFGAYSDDGEWGCKCPYAVGDYLYLKEPHYRYGSWVRNGLTKTGSQKWQFEAYIAWSDDFNIRYMDNPPDIITPNSCRGFGWYKRSPLFMPKKYARHWYVITGVRAERVQDISWADIKEEGIESDHMDEHKDMCYFHSLWNTVSNCKWESNPFVWVIEFKVVSK